MFDMKEYVSIFQKNVFSADTMIQAVRNSLHVNKQDIREEVDMQSWQGINTLNT